MGRPFEAELKCVDSTLTWAFDQEVEELKKTILANSDRPFYIVGSGGSFSACYYAAELLQFYGYPAKAITPLSLHQNRVRVFNSNIIFISASGKNTDVVSSFENTLLQDPNSTISLTLKLNSPLKKAADTYSIARHYEYALPTGKDGFLATNSLIAFFVILYKGLAVDAQPKLLDNITLDQLSQIKIFAKKNAAKKTFIVLYGGWSSAVAIDLESKFSEAALGNVLLSDYRNFGHGRHHWFDKQGKDSVIVMLSSPAEDKLAEKTISILPETIPHLKLSVNDTSPAASISLLIQSFHLVNEIGKVKNIDPGRPGVPDYGSKLYNLRYKTLVKSKSNFSLKNYLAISRKVESPEQLSSEDMKLWESAAEFFVETLSSVEFGGIVFDYDGTLCSTENRFTGMSPEICEAIISILKKGFVIGVATGRGKSVREDFQLQIPKEYWSQIAIAYYNGSDIRMLGDSELPDVTSIPHAALKRLATEIEHHPILGKKLQIELRPFQLTIKIEDIKEWRYSRRILAHLLTSLNLSDVQMLESSHSCDIVIKSKASKLHILKHCSDLALKHDCNPDFLCIGDRGQWPGNDFELLSHEFSLSVDEVSPDLKSCWNFAEAGKRNTEATLEYLSKIRWNSQNHSFSVQL